MKRRTVQATVVAAFAAALIGCGGGGGGGIVFGRVGKDVFMTEASTSVGGPHSVYLRSLSASAPILMSQLGSDCYEGDFSNATGMTVFVQNSNLWVIPRNSGTAVQKTSTQNNHHNPRFSRDGKWIVFSEDQPPQNGQPSSAIFKVAATGGTAVEIQMTEAVGLAMWPSVSPDGQKVIFAMNSAAAPGVFQLYTVPFIKGGITQVTNDTNSYSSPMYNGDQTKILCAMANLASSPPQPVQNSIVELAADNVSSYVMLAQVPTATQDPITLAYTYSSYGHPRYVSSNEVVIFDSSSLTQPASASPTWNGSVIYTWKRTTGSIAPFGTAIATYEQVQGDE